jgi:hypothetical protein
MQWKTQIQDPIFYNAYRERKTNDDQALAPSLPCFHPPLIIAPRHQDNKTSAKRSIQPM